MTRIIPAKPQTARFWTWVNSSDVKLSLPIGRMLVHIKGGRTDEGYSWETVQYYFDGDTVTRYINRLSRDCDGRFEQSYENECSLADLRGLEMGGTQYPAWQSVGSSQRDHSAEAMNY